MLDLSYEYLPPLQQDVCLQAISMITVYFQCPMKSVNLLSFFSYLPSTDQQDSCPDCSGENACDCAPLLYSCTRFLDDGSCCGCQEVCFPSSARISLENGKKVTMSELQIGDRVQTGKITRKS